MTDAERIETLERKVKAMEDYLTKVAPLLQRVAKMPPTQGENVERFYEKFGEMPNKKAGGA